MLVACIIYPQEVRETESVLAILLLELFHSSVSCN